MNVSISNIRNNSVLNMKITLVEAVNPQPTSNAGENINFTTASFAYRVGSTLGHSLCKCNMENYKIVYDTSNYQSTAEITFQTTGLMNKVYV